MLTFPREQIIEILNKLHRGFYKGQPMMMFFRDDITLEKYTASSPKDKVNWFLCLNLCEKSPLITHEIEQYNIFPDYFDSNKGLSLHQHSLTV